MHTARWLIFALLVVFILVPVVTLFRESVIGDVPLSQETLRQELDRILDRVPQDDSDAWMEEWWARLGDQERLESYAAALQAVGLQQAVQLDGLTAAEVASRLEELPPADRDRLERELRREIFLSRRAALMFRIRQYVSQAEFERLRSGSETTLTWEHYRKVLETSYLMRSITRSLWIALVSTVFTVGVAYLFAFTINRTTSRGKGFFNAMMLLPLVSPPVIMAFALVLLFGRRGLITNSLLDSTLHLIDADLTNIYGMHGIVLAQMLTYGPMAFVVLHSILAQLDTRIEEAAENLGASRFTTFWRITLPMSFPGLFRAGLLTFASCLQDFGNPRIIGGEITMIAGLMYDQMISFHNANIAAVLGVFLLVPSLVAFSLGSVLLARRTYASKEPGGLDYVSETPPALRRTLQAACGAFSVLVLGLYLTIVWGSLVKVWGYDNSLTLSHYMGVTGAEASTMEAEPTPAIPLLLGSVRTMGIAGVIGGLLAVVTGYVLERRKGLLSLAGGSLIMLTVALPGVVFGIGYILTFNTPFGLTQLSLLGTMWIIVLLVIFTRLYGGVMPAQAVLQKVDETIEEAAISLGASRLYTFRRVVFPILRRAWLLGSLYIFVSGLVSLSGVIFLQSAGEKLISIEIFLNASGGRFGLASVQSTYLIIVVLLAQVVTRHLEGRQVTRLPI
jgi:iron(III) transport system permease protein